KWVEQAGLVKFDFLGLKTLTVIENAIAQIRASGRDIHIDADGGILYQPGPGAVNDIGQIPLDDKKSYDLYASAKTVAVFQVESSGMMDALKRMKPTTIEDIVALVALYRPGPMENIPKYCEVKNGLSEREPIHPLIDHLLDETQGIIVYQEQVMEIAQVMAGYSLGGADLLRRAMGKKIQEAMDAERPKFLEGSAKNGVDKDKALEVWNLLDKFANYGFNKSHAAAYAVVSYQTAWLKANHPVEFMAGVMNCDIHLTDKLSVYFEEVRKALDLPWAPPCVNRSEADFAVKDGVLHYGLAALKNIGVEAMKLIVAARGDKPFVTLFDFARRVDLRAIGKRPLEMLARAGGFDELDRNRRRVFDSVEALSRYSAAIHEQRGSAQVSLFGEAGDDIPEPRLSPVEDWLPAERLTEEFTAVGFYLSGHPLDDYMAAFRRKDIRTLDEVTELATRQGAVAAKMAGVVASRQERKSARGNRFAFVQLSDTTGGYEVTMFSDTLDKSRDYLDTGSQVILNVEATMEADQLKLLARSVTLADDLVAGAGATGLRVFIEEQEVIKTVAKVIENAGENATKKTLAPLHLCLMDPSLPGEVELVAGNDFHITPQIKGAIKSLPGVLTVEDI
ncbi:MAG: DNA polymerase III subunit alpha, partial [Pseudomonadota bacterium]